MGRRLNCLCSLRLVLHVVIAFKTRAFLVAVVARSKTIAIARGKDIRSRKPMLEAGSPSAYDIPQKNCFSFKSSTYSLRHLDRLQLQKLRFGAPFFLPPLDEPRLATFGLAGFGLKNRLLTLAGSS